MNENSPPNVPQTQQQGAPQMTSQEPQQQYVPQVPQVFNPMSPIMETSRENYKSSTTSSSNASFSKSNLTKSHWGNTHLATQNATPGTFLTSNKSLAGKQELKPSELTANSGNYNYSSNVNIFS